MKWKLWSLVAVVVVAGLFAGYWSLWGLCGVRMARPALDNLRVLHDEWIDAVRLASSTSRIALAGPVSEIQKIGQRVRATRVPSCVLPSRDTLIQAIDESTQSFLTFMGDADAMWKVKAHSEKSSEHAKLFTTLVQFTSECVPWCEIAPTLRRAKLQSDPYTLTKDWKPLRGENLSLAMEAVGAPMKDECWWMEGRVAKNENIMHVRCFVKDARYYFEVNRTTRTASEPFTTEPRR